MKEGEEVTAESAGSEVRGERQGATLASRLIPLSRNLTLFGRAKKWVSKRRLISGLNEMMVDEGQLGGDGGMSKGLSKKGEGASIIWSMLVMSLNWFLSPRPFSMESV